MIRRMQKKILLAACLFLASCFGPSQQGGVMNYHNRLARTGAGAFEVGVLPPGWEGPHIRQKQLVYENNATHGTVVVDAQCGEKFVDAPLPRLANDLFSAMEKMTTQPGRIFTLDGRGAFRQQGNGQMDGVPLAMDVVVLKKDLCIYDFIYFAPPKNFERGQKDFEEFFHGFHTR